MKLPEKINTEERITGLEIALAFNALIDYLAYQPDKEETPSSSRVSSGWADTDEFPPPLFTGEEEL